MGMNLQVPIPRSDASPESDPIPLANGVRDAKPPRNPDFSGPHAPNHISAKVCVRLGIIIPIRKSPLSELSGIEKRNNTTVNHIRRLIKISHR